MECAGRLPALAQGATMDFQQMRRLALAMTFVASVGLPASALPG